MSWGLLEQGAFARWGAGGSSTGLVDLAQCVARMGRRCHGVLTLLRRSDVLGVRVGDLRLLALLGVVALEGGAGLRGGGRGKLVRRWGTARLQVLRVDVLVLHNPRHSLAALEVLLLLLLLLL